MSSFVDPRRTLRRGLASTLPELKRLSHSGLWLLMTVAVGACDPAGPADGTVARVIVTPEDPSVAYGLTVQLSAQAIGANGEPVTGAQFVWSMPDSETGRLDPDGLFTGLAPGSVVVTATVDGVSGSTDVTVTPLRFVSVSARHHTQCGLTVDGEAYCWGDGEWGQIGDGSEESRDVPAAVAGRHRFSQVQAGLVSCGIVSGTPHCWGGGDYGQLGTGTTTSTQTTPAPVAGDRTYAALGGGYAPACGLVEGAAYCWGLNGHGQLGTVPDETCGFQYCSRAPTPVQGGLEFVLITAGGSFTCGLTPGGEAYCWGADGSGALGDGSDTNHGDCAGGSSGGCSDVPVQVSGGLSFRSMSAGMSHVCAVTEQNTAYCWGGNRVGQLGDGSTTDRHEPTPVAASIPFAAIAAGRDLTCGLALDGRAYCWGELQLADGSLAVETSPAAVPTELSFQSITAGWRSACGIASTDRLYCWGRNSDGELGDGTRTDRTEPVEVFGQ